MANALDEDQETFAQLTLDANPGASVVLSTARGVLLRVAVKQFIPEPESLLDVKRLG